jgi:hypothetical protein
MPGLVWVCAGSWQRAVDLPLFRLIHTLTPSSGQWKTSQSYAPRVRRRRGRLEAGAGGEGLPSDTAAAAKKRLQSQLCQSSSRQGQRLDVLIGASDARPFSASSKLYSFSTACLASIRPSTAVDSPTEHRGSRRIRFLVRTPGPAATEAPRRRRKRRASWRNPRDPGGTGVR